MTYTLILELPELVYKEVKTAAEERNQSPSEWIVTSLHRLLQEGERQSISFSPLYALHESAVNTGVRDLADQHDHYLYGAAKQYD